MVLNNKNILVIGTGKSGISASVLLHSQKARVTLFDENKKSDREEIKKKIPAGIQVVIGSLEKEYLEKLDLAVISPGVPVDSPSVLKLKEMGIQVIGEIELAYRFSKGKIVAITGTNGKTTTTSLAGEIIKSYYQSVFVVGNIGNPFSGISDQTQDNSVIVAEISSFQLETTEEFHPAVSAVLNLTPDHLDRHHSMENYINTKLSITKAQTGEDFCILNYEDEILREKAKELIPQVLFFSSKRKLSKGIYLSKDKYIIYSDGNEEVKVCKTSELALLGTHNYENVMAAVLMAVVMGVPMEFIRKTCLRFKAVEHRIEYVCEKNGVKYYNDSKGTNPDAAIRGILAMESPTLLIGGGYDKNADYTEWIESFRGKVKLLVLIGQTREKIQKTALQCGFDKVVLSESLEEAVKICYKNAETGDCVLLSPACASWGMFRNYEERGVQFKELAKNL